MEIFEECPATFVTFKQVLENFPKSSQSGQKSLENRHQYLAILTKTLHASLKIWILCSCHSNKKIHIFSPLCNILYASIKYLSLIQLCNVTSTPLKKNMLHYDYNFASGQETFPNTTIFSTVLLFYSWFSPVMWSKL